MLNGDENEVVCFSKEETERDGTAHRSTERPTPNPGEPKQQAQEN
jgi:hypothetical protein